MHGAYTLFNFNWVTCIEYFNGFAVLDFILLFSCIITVIYTRFIGSSAV